MIKKKKMISLNKVMNINKNKFIKLSKNIMIYSSSYNKKINSFRNQRFNIIIYKNNMMNCKMNK